MMSRFPQPNVGPPNQSSVFTSSQSFGFQSSRSRLTLLPHLITTCSSCRCHPVDGHDEVAFTPQQQISLSESSTPFFHHRLFEPPIFHTSCAQAFSNRHRELPHGPHKKELAASKKLYQSFIYSTKTLQNHFRFA